MIEKNRERERRGKRRKKRREEAGDGEEGSIIISLFLSFSSFSSGIYRKSCGNYKTFPTTFRRSDPIR